MVAHRTLIGRPQPCTPIKQPKGVVTAGFYPTVSCLRREASTNETTVSRELPSSAGEVTGAAGGDELESAVEGPGKKDDARQMLATIYAWFPEGHDTPDLQEADTLLQALA